MPRWGEIIPPLAAFLLLAMLPYLEELVRGFRHTRPERDRPFPDQL